MNLKLVALFTILIMSMGVTQSFAAQVTINVDGSFAPGEKVEISGIVSGGNEGELAAIEVKDDSGETILIRTVELGSNGSFTLKFKIPASSESSNYDVVVNTKVDGQAVTESKTVDVGQPSSTATTQSKPSGGGCLIATAAYGSELAPQVQFLRELRDNTVLQTQSGISFMSGFNQFYYTFSPQIADYERENPMFKEMVKVTLTPLLTSLTLLNHVEINSEEEILGYGIGIILLNVGMYFVAPAVLIIALKNRLKN